MTVRYVDLVGGSDAADGLSFANRKKTLASAAGSAGDEIRIMMSPVASSLGQDATFTNKSINVTLTSALTQAIYSDGAWTANTNVTCTTNTGTRKEGANSSSNAIGAAFTTGKAAHFATGTLDLSGYQQISFWIQPSIAIASGVLRLDLCSDTSGNTPVDQFTINYSLRANLWHVLTIDKGSALGSSIQSISLNCVSDPGTVTVLLDGIIACKATTATDCLTLNHLIGKNDEEWWAIRNIVGTTVEVETGGITTAQGAGRGFSGITGSFPIYAKLPLPVTDTPSGTTASIQTYSGAAGTSGNLVLISGGWNATDMSTQVGDTLVDALCVNGRFWMDSNSRSFVSFSKLGGVRGNSLCGSTSSTGNVYADLLGVNMASNFLINNPSSLTMTNCRAYGCLGLFWATFDSSGGSFNLSNIYIKSSTNGQSQIPIGGSLNSPNSGSTLENIYLSNNANNNATPTLSLFTEISLCRNLVLRDNAGASLSPCGNIYDVACYDNGSSALRTNSIISGSKLGNTKIFNISSSGNGTTFFAPAGGNSTIVVYDGVIAEATKMGTPTNDGRSMLILHRMNNDIESNFFYVSNIGTIQTQVSVVPPGMPRAWQYSPTGSTLTSVHRSLGRYEMPVARVACVGGATNTFTFNCRRTNTNLTCNLRVLGGRYPGVGSSGNDIVTSVNPPADTWDDFSISITPTESCVVDIFFECYHNGTTTYSAYVAGPVVPS